MRYLSLALALMLSCSGWIQAQNRPEEAETKTLQTQVPVRTVVLFSSGVGYFEHAGTVKDNTNTELRFKTDQINDILKSLVLEDQDGGTISSIVYPSQDPMAKTLKSFQVDITSNPSLGELLNQLRGAKIKVSVQAETVEGTILGLEKKQKAIGKDSEIVEVWVLNLVSGGILRSLDMDLIQKIELEDTELQQELEKALCIVSQSRDQDKKPVTIHFKGKAERRVRLGYVVETPIWKTSYRMTMPEKGSSKGKIQGWAIIENQTDNDWNHVQLSLVSGRPISFIQELYEPLYISRPVVRQQLYASLHPQTYEAGLKMKKDIAPMAAFEEAKAAPAPRMAMAAGYAKAEAEYESYGQGSSMNAFSSISSAASAEKIGELFQYTVEDVSLPRQSSSMIPIVADEIEIEKLSIYNPNVLGTNPLNGAKLKNTSGKYLLQGPVTVFDGNTYAGDAQIDNLPSGQERFLSYAVDLEVLVNVSNNKEDSFLQTGKIIKGSLLLTRKNVLTQDYKIGNKSDQDKVLIIEHPFRSGWKLLDTPAPIETTDTLYRFKIDLPANKSSTFTVKEEWIEEETLAILPADFGLLEFYSKTGEIPKNVREALLKAMSLKGTMEETLRQIDKKKNDLREITLEQQRIRSNMNTVDKNSQYYTRLLTKLNDQENLIEKTQEEINTLTQTYENQRKDLENYLSTLNVE